VELLSNSFKVLPYTVFLHINNLLTLKPAAQKGARGIINENDLGIIEDAALVVKAGKISWVGKSRDLPKAFQKKGLKRIDLKGRTVVPAFVECHTHSVFAGNRAHEFELRQQGMSYLEIALKGGGILSTVRATREVTKKELQKNLVMWAQMYLSQGVTTLEIKSGYGLSDESEIKMLEVIKGLKWIRTVATYLGPHAVPAEFSSSTKYIDHIIKHTLPLIKKKKLAERADIFIENGYFSLEDGERYLSAAKKLGFDLTIHADQMSHTGAAALGCKLGAKSVDHLVELSDADIKTLGLAATTCVLLPIADYYLKIRYPRGLDLAAANARIALATDFNPGSSPSADLMFAGLLARMQMGLSLSQVIVAYTLGAAYALGLETQVGSIEVSKDADFLVLSGAWQELFYQVGFSPVTQVWTRGQKIYEKKFAI